MLRERLKVRFQLLKQHVVGRDGRTWRLERCSCARACLDYASDDARRCQPVLDRNGAPFIVLKLDRDLGISANVVLRSAGLRCGSGGLLLVDGQMSR